MKGARSIVYLRLYVCLIGEKGVCVCVVAVGCSALAQLHNCALCNAIRVPFVVVEQSSFLHSPHYIISCCTVTRAPIRSGGMQVPLEEASRLGIAPELPGERRPRRKEKKPRGQGRQAGRQASAVAQQQSASTLVTVLLQYVSRQDDLRPHEQVISDRGHPKRQ